MSRDQPQTSEPGGLRLLLAVAAGGLVGSIARYGATVLAPHEPGTFAWTVLAVNVLGSGLLGLLMGVIATGTVAHPLARPFLGVGVLGGFTTFSTFTLDAAQLAEAGAVAGAVAYVGLTTAGCLATALGGFRLASSR